jgi:hypothetical protein
MRNERHVLTVLGSALGVCVIALVISVIALVQTTSEYDPLGEYPVQRVDSKIFGYSSPSVYLSTGEVIITGTKCAETETKIEGRTTWTEIVPGGAVIPMPKGTAVRTAGCTTRTFHNRFPDEVVDRVKFSALRGRKQTVWQISGVETPIAPGGRRGVRVAWQSQNFTIVYD